MTDLKSGSVKLHCPKCNGLAVSRSTQDMRPFLNKLCHSLECGHSLFEEILAMKPEVKLERDQLWNKAFDYQKEGVKFIEESNYNCLIADEQGLGKTIQALLAVRYNYENLSPFVLVSKSSLQINWIREYMKWVLEVDTSNPDAIKTIPIAKLPFIHASKDLALVPGFNFYLVSMDMLSPTVLESFVTAGIKTIIVDECHNFKNVASKRTQALRKISPFAHHHIFLSGTPVLNRTVEYFPILNMLAPLMFPEPKYFMEKYLQYNYQMKKYLSFMPRMKEVFFNQTKKFILRREVKDVQKDLPPIFYQKHYVNDFTKEMATQYNKILIDLEVALANKRNAVSSSSSILGILTNLRHLTGLMKVTACIEHIEAFLESNEDEKICIGIHHKLVADMLMAGLAKHNPIRIDGSDDSFVKDKKRIAFSQPGNRICIMNVLAGGEGGNYQFCNNALILERQWNPGKEEQFIKRFNRYGQDKTVFVNYMIAASTIDDFMDELISMKKEIVNDTTDDEYQLDSNFINALATKIVSTRLRITKM